MNNNHKLQINMNDDELIDTLTTKQLRSQLIDWNISTKGLFDRQQYIDIYKQYNNQKKIKEINELNQQKKRNNEIIKQIKSIRKNNKYNKLELIKELYRLNVSFNILDDYNRLLYLLAKENVEIMNKPADSLTTNQSTNYMNNYQSINYTQQLYDIFTNYTTHSNQLINKNDLIYQLSSLLQSNPSIYNITTWCNSLNSYELSYLLTIRGFNSSTDINLLIQSLVNELNMEKIRQRRSYSNNDVSNQVSASIPKKQSNEIKFNVNSYLITTWFTVLNKTINKLLTFLYDKIIRFTIWCCGKTTVRSDALTVAIAIVSLLINKGIIGYFGIMISIRLIRLLYSTKSIS